MTENIIFIVMDDNENIKDLNTNLLYCNTLIIKEHYVSQRFWTINHF